MSDQHRDRNRDRGRKKIFKYITETLLLERCNTLYLASFYSFPIESSLWYDN